MEMQDRQIIAAPRLTVFEAILTPDMLKACIPGAEEVTGSLDTGFEAVVVQKVGPVKAKFRGVVTMEDIVPGTSLRLIGEGKGEPPDLPRGPRPSRWPIISTVANWSTLSRRRSAAKSHSSVRASLMDLPKRWPTSSSNDSGAN